MNYGTLSPAIASGLLRLQKRIARGQIPPLKIDETLIVATWNVGELGRTPGLEASLHYIAEVMGTSI